MPDCRDKKVVWCLWLYHFLLVVSLFFFLFFIIEIIDVDISTIVPDDEIKIV